MEDYLNKLEYNEHTNLSSNLFDFFLLTFSHIQKICSRRLLKHLDEKLENLIK